LTPLLVVQERRRLYQESMTACLRRQLDAIDVAEGVADAARLLRLAESRHLDHAVIEVDGVPWDVARLAGSLRRHNPSVQVIGLSASARSSAIDGVRVLSRGAGPDQVAELVSPGHVYDMPFVLTSGASSSSSPLSGQQLRVLALLSLGMTVGEVAVRLGLSERAVTKAKVAIFAKLGVASQARAVAGALAAGWLGPPTASSLVTTGKPS
jgi:DNA-binding NarL/FixJ family response regulator